MKQTDLYLWYPVLQAQSDGCDQQNLGRVNCSKHANKRYYVVKQKSFFIDNIFVIFGVHVSQHNRHTHSHKL
jgi:hypothetical protein